MIEITGKDAKGFEEKEFYFIGNLARTESGAPLIRLYSIYKDSDKDPVVWVLVEKEADITRWLVFPIKPEYIEAYLNGEMAADELMISARGPAFGKEYYIFEHDDMDIISTLRVHNEDVPPKYCDGMSKFSGAAPDEVAIREYLATLS